MTRATPAFNPAARTKDKQVPFAYAFDHMIKEIRHLSRGTDSIDQFEPEIRATFTKFLTDLNMPLALKNFEALLQEKSGKKFLRNDGTINWYHELIPLIEMMELARRGRKNGGFDLKDLEPYGGLEVLLCTHLRHDSVEDFIKTNLDMVAQQMTFVNEICEGKSAAFTENMHAKALFTMVNIDLMSQKVTELPDGTKVKEDVREYISRLVNSKEANPIVFMCKQADINHNFATLFAPKFTADRRLKRCNEREDMYGPRYGFADLAFRKWPEFAVGMNALDSMMGFMLYPHFRYLESVDLFYKDSSEFPVGIERYLRRVMNVHLPAVINPACIFLKRMMSSIDPDAEPEKFERLRHFLQKVIMPPLEPYKERFPFLFENPVYNTPAAAPAVAMP
jgi:hypothetical protein